MQQRPLEVTKPATIFIMWPGLDGALQRNRTNRKFYIYIKYVYI